MNVCNLSQPHSQNVNETAKRKWFVSIVNPTRVLTCSTSQSLSREALNFFMQASARCKWVEYCEWKYVKIIYQCIVLIQFSLIYTTYKLFNTTTKVNYNIRGTFLVLLFFCEISVIITLCCTVTVVNLQSEMSPNKILSLLRKNSLLSLEVLILKHLWEYSLYSKLNYMMIFKRQKSWLLIIPLTMLSSFWYCGIFFNICERSFMLAWNARHLTMIAA